MGNGLRWLRALPTSFMAMTMRLEPVGEPDTTQRLAGLVVPPPSHLTPTSPEPCGGLAKRLVSAGLIRTQLVGGSPQCPLP